MAVKVSELPSNSKKAKRATEKASVEKVVTGKASIRKKSLGDKFSETFFGDDLSSVTKYVIQDVMIPAAKSMISDAVSGGIEMLLFGEKRSRGSSRLGAKSHISYSSISAGRNQPLGNKRNSRDFDDILFDNRGDAENVLEALVDLVADYGQATVADLYDAAGMTSDHTDFNWGWTNLATSQVSRVSGGYMIKFPRVEAMR